jgi:hypothetical protein
MQMHSHVIASSGLDLGRSSRHLFPLASPFRPIVNLHPKCDGKNPHDDKDQVGTLTLGCIPTTQHVAAGFPFQHLAYQRRRAGRALRESADIT